MEDPNSSLPNVEMIWSVHTAAPTPGPHASLSGVPPMLEDLRLDKLDSNK